jgi:hypothetical protein
MAEVTFRMQKVCLSLSSPIDYMIATVRIATTICMEATTHPVRAWEGRMEE